MWEETSTYRQIMRCAEAWSKTKITIYVKAIWIRGDGQYQQKELYVPNYYLVEWFEDNLGAYWDANESEMKIMIENQSFYWKHPTITAPITIAEVEEISKRREREFWKSARITDNVIEFGVENG